MALEGGGNRKTKGEHSPKSYKQSKSIFWRITDSIKDVLRPSWLAGDTGDTDDAAPAEMHDISDEEQSSVVTDKDCKLMNKEQSSEALDISVQASQPELVPQLSSTSGIPGSSVGLWSISPGSPTGLWSQSSTSSSGGPGHNRTTAVMSPLVNSKTTGMLQSSKRPVGSFMQSPRSFKSSSSRIALPRPNMSQPSLSSFGEQRQRRSCSTEGSGHFAAGANSSLSGSSVSPSKRQKLLTPETSRKGRPLQPALPNQPSFKMSVFCSSPSQCKSVQESASSHGRTVYGGGSSLCRKESLNSSLSYLGSPPVRKSVTPKPVTKPGGAVLGTTTTRILKTFERMSDNKRMRINLSSDGGPFLSPPSSNRKPSKPLHKNVPSHSMEVMSPSAAVSAAKSRQIVSHRAAVSLVPAQTAQAPAQKTQNVEVIDVSGDDDDEDDVLIVDGPKDVIERASGGGSMQSQSKGRQMHCAKPSENHQQQIVIEDDEECQIMSPVKVTQRHSIFNHQSHPVAGYGPSSASLTPPVTGFATPCLKSSSVIGSASSSVSGSKTVTFIDTANSPASEGFVVSPGGTVKSSVPRRGVGILGESPEPLSSVVRAPVSTATTLEEDVWECDMCLIQNSAEDNVCMACETPKSNMHLSGMASQAVDSAPAFGSSESEGGLLLGSSVPASTAPLFQAPSTVGKSFGDFQFGTSSSTTASPATGGFQLGTPISGENTPSTAVGFQFGASPLSSTSGAPKDARFNCGNPNIASFNSYSNTSGFQLGAKGLSGGHNSNEFGSGVTSAINSKSKATEGLFGTWSANSGSSVGTGFVFGKTPVCSAGLDGSSSLTVSNSSAECRVGTGKSHFGVSNQCQSRNSDANCNTKTLTSSEVSHIERRPTDTYSSISSAEKTCNSISVCVAPSVSGGFTSLTSSGFLFNENKDLDNSSPFKFASEVSSKVTLNGGDSCVRQDHTVLNSFSPANGGGVRSGLFASPTNITSPVDASSKSTPSLFTASSGSKGFLFGASSPSPNLASSATFSPPSSVTKPSTGLLGRDSSFCVAKSPINGEAGAIDVHTFSKKTVTGSPETTGFSFGSVMKDTKEVTEGQNLFSQSKQSFVFGAPSGLESTSPKDKDHNDNGLAGKMPDTSLFGSRPSGVSSEHSGFSFNPRTNAASSKEVPSPHTSLFGAGSGNTSTGQFSFNVGAGSQSNAAAASPLASKVSAPTQGFSFSGTKQSSFSFGSSAPVFQFASPQTVVNASEENTRVKPTVSDSSDNSSSPALVFSAPTTVAAPAQNTFSLGAGESPRIVRKAVRRIQKK